MSYKIIITIAVLLLLGGAGLVLLKPTKQPDPINNSQTNSQQAPTAEQTERAVSWHYDGVWQANQVSPPCPSAIIAQTPVDLHLATSILYPGQVRSGEYKPHGGFRFDQSVNADISVYAPQDAWLVRGARYLVEGEPQYMFDLINDCGLMYRLGHLRELSPKMAQVVKQLRKPRELDSHTTELRPPIKIKAGEIMATAVGLENTSNVFMDFGVFDLRQQNQTADDPEWLANHAGQLDPYALCWLDLLPSGERTVAKSLPGADGVHGKQSDYCRS